jgi:iron-sulfur cluster repair protein YtfE (RIC family)
MTGVGLVEGGVVMVPITANIDPRPAEVRAQVLAQHHELKELIQRAQKATTWPGEPSFERAEHVVRLAEELYARFENHLRFEERFLFPALRDADVWGDERVAALTKEHALQRGDLERFIDLVDSQCPPEELRGALAALSEKLLEDIAEEEDACLDADLLRDDLVAVDQMVG